MKIDLEEFQRDINQNFGGSYKVEILPNIWIERLIEVYESFHNNEPGVTLAAPMLAVIKNQMFDCKLNTISIGEDELLLKLYQYFVELQIEKINREKCT